jgi:hypothetical protein
LLSGSDPAIFSTNESTNVLPGYIAPHTYVETIQAIELLVPFKVFSWHFYEEQSGSISNQRALTMMFDGRMGLLSFITTLFLNFSAEFVWLGLLMVSAGLTLHVKSSAAAFRYAVSLALCAIPSFFQVNEWQGTAAFTIAAALMAYDVRRRPNFSTVFHH